MRRSVIFDRGALAFLMILASPVLPATAIAQTAVATGVSGVETYGPLPTGFDPAAATAHTLDEIGLPPRPDRHDDPEGYAAWLEDVSPDIVRVAAPGPQMTRKVKKQPSNNWSGIVIESDVSKFGSKSFSSIHASWTMPVVQPPLQACKKNPGSGPFLVSVWPGIGGFSPAEDALIQAGATAESVCEKGRSQTRYWTWYEFYPYPSTMVDTLPISPGDTLSVYVWVASAREGHAYLVNRTTKKSASIKLKAPAGTSLIGASAEWIVEAPENDGSSTDLANYSELVVHQAKAAMKNGKSHFPGKESEASGLTLYNLYMTVEDQPKEKISVAETIGKKAIHYKTVGPARSAKN